MRAPRSGSSPKDAEPGVRAMSTSHCRKIIRSATCRRCWRTGHYTKRRDELLVRHLPTESPGT
ncbi:hypothetical protein EXIGLDRAFT_730458 [Exidia glandulosa HHB12029]|uniref:Uncharacterized protein n=1 Tax=Exidia glandulosa HHB12029 TaxID=1314781 RepID=A0A165L8W0_EXIGL|nr:hypothetical protein EXIGLDRAFT_730458 [Exidia glandulosa HHB12029]